MTGGGEQFAGSSETGGLPVVLAVLGQIRELATLVQSAPGWQLSDAEARLAVKEAAVAARQIESAYLGLVYELDQRPGVVKGARAGFQARTFIRHSLNQTTAHAKDDVAAAYALRPDADPAKGGLPRLGAAFAAGEVSREHVNAAVRAASRIPKPLLSAPVAADIPAGANPGTSAGSAGEAADETHGESAADTAHDSATDKAADAEEATAEADQTAATSSAPPAAAPSDADSPADPDADAGAATGTADIASAGNDGGRWGLFRCGGDVVDEEFTRHARDYDPAATARLARELVEGLDPDGASSFDPDACMKRNLRLIQDGEGMWLLNGVLDPASGAFLKAMLDHLSKPRPTRTETADDGTLVDVEDTRTAGQRNADALMDLVRQGQAANLGTRGGEPPRITIITSADDLAAARAADPSTHPASGAGPAPENDCPAEDPVTSDADPDEENRRWINPWTPPPARPHHNTPGTYPGDAGQGGRLATGERINPLLLARLSCDSILQAVLLAPSGAILDQGREARTVTPAQRRALTARDHGCVVPGCTAPAHWCEAHHVTYWRDNGPTDIANLALVCARHHTEIHLGIWILTMRDGVPWITPPQWLDPTQTPLQNGYVTDLATTRAIGTQLRLNLNGDNNQPPESLSG